MAHFYMAVLPRNRVLIRIENSRMNFPAEGDAQHPRHTIVSKTCLFKGGLPQGCPPRRHRTTGGGGGGVGTRRPEADTKEVVPLPSTPTCKMAFPRLSSSSYAMALDPDHQILFAHLLIWEATWGHRKCYKQQLWISMNIHGCPCVCAHQ